MSKMDEMTKEKIMLDDELRRVAREIDRAASRVSTMVSDGELRQSWSLLASGLNETAGAIRGKLAEL